jgi:hypothetical protein
MKSSSSRIGRDFPFRAIHCAQFAVQEREGLCLMVGAARKRRVSNHGVSGSASFETRHAGAPQDENGRRSNEG